MSAQNPNLSLTSEEWYAPFRVPDEDPDEKRCLHELFEEAAARDPSALAIVDGKSRLTYGELEAASARVAARLRRDGVGVESVVGIFMERSCEFLVAYLGILRAGAAYTPLELAYPAPLLASVLADLRPAAVVTKTRWRDRLDDAGGTLVLTTDSWRDDGEVEARGAPTPGSANRTRPDGGTRPDPSSLAYVVYSSGTTGKPKGIMCPHRGAVFSYGWRHRHFPIADSDVVACNVFFVWEALRPLVAGRAVVVIPDDVIYDPVLLVPFLKRHGVTRILLTPSLLQAVLDAPASQVSAARDLAGLRLLWLCGEVVTRELRDRALRMLPNVRLLNLFSVSECHDVSVADLTGPPADPSSRFCSAGRVFSRAVEVHVLDEALRPVPVGHAGDIFVSGCTLARGYLNMPEKTAERFFEHGGVRLYRTGDVGALTEHGDLVIHGRVDSMQKVRGYSVQLGAVEAAVRELPQVLSAAVLVDGDEGEDKRVVAFVVLADPAHEPTVTELQAGLRQSLPHYAIPSVFVPLPRIPLSDVTGKLQAKLLPKVADARALPFRAAGGGGSAAEAAATAATAADLPVDDTERALCEVWRDVLGLDAPAGRHDHFMALGGHSLLAARAVAAVRERLGATVTVGHLFDEATGTPAGLALALRSGLDGDAGSGAGAGGAAGGDINFEREARLPRGISGDLTVPARPWSCVVLTGATGYLGAFLLRELLRRDPARRVVCVARAESDRAALARVLANAAHLRAGLSPDEEARVSAVAGDLELPHLGLSVDAFEALGRRADAVVHCASRVHLMMDYASLRAANVDGTVRALRLACVRAGTAFTYVSTLGVLPLGGDEAESDMPRDIASLPDGYCQSKAVAELMVHEAARRGVRASVFRPGNMAADSVNGVWNELDFHYILLAACERMGPSYLVLGKEVAWDLELTPVDYAAALIAVLAPVAAAAAAAAAAADEKGAAAAPVYHAVNPRRVPYRELVASLAGPGAPPRMWSGWEAWRRRVFAGGEPQLEALLGGVESPAGLALGVMTNTCARTVEALRAAGGPACPEHSPALAAVWGLGLRRQALPAPRPLPLEGRVAIVTGASSGIGAEVAARLAREGARVALAARRLDRLEAVADAVRAALPPARRAGVVAVRADVTSREDVAALAAAAERELGPPDIVVQCAGVMPYTMLKNLHEDEWQTMLQVNCQGVMNGVGATLAGMLERGRGHYVHISSDAGRKVFPGLAVYSATKAFVEFFTRGLRTEVAGRGVRVTSVQPGDVRTELNATTTDAEAFALADYLKDPALQILRPADVAEAVLYALTQPPHVAVNELLVEPTALPI